MLYNGNYLEFE